MKERIILRKEKLPLQIKSQQEVTTAGVKIVKFNLVSKGTIHTVYSQISSDVILDGLLEKIENDKILAKNPSFASYIESKVNKTPEEYITTTSLEYIKALKAKKNISTFRIDLLHALIKQEALRRLFENGKPQQ